MTAHRRRHNRVQLLHKNHQLMEIYGHTLDCFLLHHRTSHQVVRDHIHQNCSTSVLSTPLLLHAHSRSKTCVHHRHCFQIDARICGTHLEILPQYGAILASVHNQAVFLVLQRLSTFDMHIHRIIRRATSRLTTLATHRHNDRDNWWTHRPQSLPCSRWKTLKELHRQNRGHHLI